MYKTIFTYLPSSKTASLISSVAASIGEQCGANIIGAHNSVRIVLYGGIPSDYLAQHNQQQREEAEAIEGLFVETIEARGLAHEWRHRTLVDDEAFDDIVSAARSSDLIVAGGQGKGDPLGQWKDLPLRLILESGRPVVLIPENGVEKAIAENVTIAWDHSRESARAAFDALPLLKLADSVKVLAVNSTKAGMQEPSEPLVTALARHGVKVEGVVSNTTERSEAEEVLAEHDRMRGDLLVMGCYGHSRLREMVLGGATRHILDHMTTPVLMSH